MAARSSAMVTQVVVVEAIAISFTTDFLTIPLLLATSSCVLSINRFIVCLLPLVKIVNLL